MVSKLFAAAASGGVTENEILWLCLTLLVGGQETMTHFLGNMLDALLNHPDQLRLVRERPELIAPTIEETARFYPPVQNVFRTATTDVVVGNTTIPQGARVELSFAAGNRDPRKFPDPNAYRIDRVTDGHLGFGAGIHTCVGAHLARLRPPPSCGCSSSAPTTSHSSASWSRCRARPSGGSTTCRCG